MDGTPGTPAAHGRPGRPRDASADARVLNAVNDLLVRGDEVTIRAIVDASGVSRGSIYRRWQSVTNLVAAALDDGRAPYPIPDDGTVLGRLTRMFVPASPDRFFTSYSEERLRVRLRLSLADPDLQRAYWEGHVERRRLGLVRLLQQGIERGELRADLDIDACIDLVSAVVYYQVVVRGAPLRDAAVRDRVRSAIEIAWAGMALR